MAKAKVTIVGLGRVGSTFAMALQDSGYAIEVIKGQRELEVGCPEEKTLASDIVLLTTSDSKIAWVVNFLVRRKGFRSGQILMHMSGAYTSDLLTEAKSLGVSTCSLHPLQSFAEPTTAIKTLADTVFTVEGDQEAIDIADNLVKNLGAQVFEIKKEAKPLYHAAACVAANYLVTIMKSSLDLMVAAGIPKSHSWKAIAPLVKGTLNNIETFGAASALTGPISRGDAATLKYHLENIYQHKEELFDLYCCLGKHTLDLAQEKGSLSGDVAMEIKQLLEGQRYDSEKGNHEIL